MCWLDVKVRDCWRSSIDLLEMLCRVLLELQIMATIWVVRVRTSDSISSVVRLHVCGLIVLCHSVIKLKCLREFYLKYNFTTACKSEHQVSQVHKVWHEPLIGSIPGTFR